MLSPSKLSCLETVLRRYFYNLISVLVKTFVVLVIAARLSKKIDNVWNVGKVVTEILTNIYLYAVNISDTGNTRAGFYSRSSLFLFPKMSLSWSSSRYSLVSLIDVNARSGLGVYSVFDHFFEKWFSNNFCHSPVCFIASYICLI